MALVEAKLEGDLTAGLDRLLRPQAEDVIYSGAAAMARVIYAEVKLNTSGVKPKMPGIVTGNLNESIYWAKDTNLSTPNKAVYAISWNKAKAPHGHLLEFGTSRMQAYPFVRPAADKMNEAIKQGVARMKVRFAELSSVR